MALCAEKLVKNYGRRRAVDGVSVRVDPGEVVGLLGPNGAGKTTTFYSIVGFVRPDAGQILLEGDLPDPRARPSGCVFRTRCPMADGICAEREPDWHRQEHGGYSACHFAARHASPMTARAMR